MNKVTNKLESIKLRGYSYLGSDLI